MEKSVKSHPGRVMVVNVMIQYNAPGSTVKIFKRTRTRVPKVEGDVFSTTITVAAADAVARDRVDGKLLIRELAAELTAPAGSMVGWWGRRRPQRVGSRGAVSEGEVQRMRRGSTGSHCEFRRRRLDSGGARKHGHAHVKWCCRGPCVPSQLPCLAARPPSTRFTAKRGSNCAAHWPTMPPFKDEQIIVCPVPNAALFPPALTSSPDHRARLRDDTRTAGPARVLHPRPPARAVAHVFRRKAGRMGTVQGAPAKRQAWKAG